jgi:two-component system sensor histidine kinase ChiS
MGGLAFFLSMIVLFFTISFDIIATYLADMDTNYIYVGMMTILFSQSFILSKRFAEAYKTADHLSKNLQKEVAEQTKIIKEKNEERITYFINFAHETKTPLTLILNYLKKYVQKRGMDSDLKIIQDNIEKLKKNMVNFLDYEKLEKGREFYNHELVTNMSAAVQNSVNLFKEIAEQKHIHVKTDIKADINVKADPAAVDRIINNLLDNAFKYTPEGGQLHVILRSEKEYFKLLCEDNGIGIAHEQLKHIFKPFYQISNIKRNIQGIGMGLNIVKKIIDDLGGKIDVQSTPGRGSRFTIQLKRYKVQKGDLVSVFNGEVEYAARPDKRGISSDNIKGTAKYTLLIVEDNPDMLSYLADSLNEEYNVYCAGNGKQALAKLEYIPNVRLVVSDIMMDIMDGYEFYEEFKKNVKYRHIPVIFLTAKNTQFEKVRALQKGAVDFVCKPFDIEELKARISALIKISESQFEKSKQELIKHIIKSSKSGISVEDFSFEFDNKCRQYNISLREKEIMLLIFKGKQYKEISHELGVSTNTVKTHINNIYKKLGVKKKIEFIKKFKSR